MSIIYLYYIDSFFICQFDIKEKWDEFQVLFQAMIFETAFQNLVVLIYIVKRMIPNIAKRHLSSSVKRHDYNN